MRVKTRGSKTSHGLTRMGTSKWKGWCWEGKENQRGSGVDMSMLIYCSIANRWPEDTGGPEPQEPTPRKITHPDPLVCSWKWEDHVFGSCIPYKVFASLPWVAFRTCWKSKGSGPYSPTTPMATNDKNLVYIQRNRKHSCSGRVEKAQIPIVKSHLYEHKQKKTAAGIHYEKTSKRLLTGSNKNVMPARSRR